MFTTKASMKKSLVALCLLAAFATANAGVPEVVAAQQAVELAKAKVKALKAALTKREKAELAVALATAKLASMD